MKKMKMRNYRENGRDEKIDRREEEMRSRIVKFS